ncbi:hypothetical protein GH714_018754 [Hevea brasiliensis]|uniref:J domain-containing protein n=1 Tax=Hevea brasiliensis TaxID=3981 RepID=A0A6A6MCG0_HEVBR|nr:hypothetical protein GH714_018754 [Hevea brasiliensis]
MDLVGDRLNDVYLRGVEEFLDYAFKKTGRRGEIRCPCVKCSNTYSATREVVGTHLKVYGIIRNYTFWYHHGERVGESESNLESVQQSEDEPSNEMHDILRDLYPEFCGQDTNDMDTDIFACDIHKEEPNEEANKFYRLLRDFEQPLYQGIELELIFPLELIGFNFKVSITQKKSWGRKTMDGNKDEALRCVRIAEEAIASGNKDRALKFIRIAQRLNHNLSIDELLAACEKLDSSGSSPSSLDENRVVDYDKNRPTPVKIDKAYRKLSLKVHPDKNKAPGSEEAFKKVCKAFKCLSDDSSRRQYDQTGLVDDFEYSQQSNLRRTRRRRTVHEFYDDDFDPDEIFRNYYYQITKATEKHGLEFFVKSAAFDDNFPIGSPARANIEDNVIRDYRNLLWRHCHMELQRHQWNKNIPTPNCDKLRNLGLT